MWGGQQRKGLTSERKAAPGPAEWGGGLDALGAQDAQLPEGGHRSWPVPTRAVSLMVKGGETRPGAQAGAAERAHPGPAAWAGPIASSAAWAGPSGEGSPDSSCPSYCAPGPGRGRGRPEEGVVSESTQVSSSCTNPEGSTFSDQRGFQVLHQACFTPHGSLAHCGCFEALVMARRILPSVPN